MNTLAPTSLQNLHDIVVPEPAAWLPPAPGWYAMGFSLLLVLGWFSISKYLAWKRNQYRREALAEFGELKTQLTENSRYQQLLPELPRLVKRTAMAAYGRDLAASLTDDEWLNFLNNTGSTLLFTEGSGRLLNECSYQSIAKLAQFSTKEVTGLQEAVFFWLRNHKKSIQKQV